MISLNLNISSFTSIHQNSILQCMSLNKTPKSIRVQQSDAAPWDL